MEDKTREDKWHEDMFIGVLFAVMGFMFLFNGYSKLASGFIDDGGIEGGPTKQKGIIALLSLLENGWWSYIIVALFLFLAYDSAKRGIRKYKVKK